MGWAQRRASSPPQPSLMIKPVKQLSLQMPIRQLMLCEVATNKRKLDDADLDGLWRPVQVAAEADDE